jgi:ParB family chromosome partitioning protein
MGDSSELMASVAEKGVIEPLIVRQRGGRYQIIAGERRYHAAVQVGLREIPVVVREVDDAEVMELALVENLQRKDLTAFEEAEALHQLSQRCDYTHEDMARKLGKSRTAITESLSLNRCRTRSATYVGWPTLHPSRRCCRSFDRKIPRR